MKKILKLKKMDYVVHGYFGPLYIVDSFRDCSGRVFCGINGIDGVSYNFNADEVLRKINRTEFDRMPKCAKGA